MQKHNQKKMGFGYRVKEDQRAKELNEKKKEKKKNLNELNYYFFYAKRLASSVEVRSKDTR